jgi:adenosylcobyric acid synthase
VLYSGASVRGYEIHCGVSTGKALEFPAVYLEGQADGAISADGQILATYLHGLFDAPEALQALLAWAGLTAAQTFDINAVREQQLERLADTLEAHLDLGKVLSF